jgi:hypothetical protein
MEKLGIPITIIGAGSVGSFTAFTLAKAGFSNITVIDFDKVEIENMSSQLYRPCDIGKQKVVALKELIKMFCDTDIEVVDGRYDGKPLSGIVIMAVDSMEVRADIWKAHAEIAFGTQLLIDPRMAAESSLCYAMNPLDPADCVSYAKTLYTDEQAVHERCTAKATGYCSLALSSHIVKVIKDFLCNEDHNYTRVMEWSLRNNMQICHPKIKPIALSAEAKLARTPQKPQDLVGALQDTIHRDVGKGRVARTVRTVRKKVVTKKTK